VFVGYVGVRQWRAIVARGEKAAARKVAADAAKQGHVGEPPPRPIPADIIALALLHLPKWAKAGSLLLPSTVTRTRDGRASKIKQAPSTMTGLAS
jgi:hypothetical protein